MGRFDSAQALAKRLIDLNGEAVVLTVFTTTTPDPDKPWLPGDSAEQDVPAKAVFLNYKESQMYMEGSDIHRGDKKILIAAVGLEADPNLQGSITRLNGDVYKVASIKLLDPNGQKILFEIQGRQ